MLRLRRLALRVFLDEVLLDGIDALLVLYVLEVHSVLDGLAPWWLLIR